MAGKKGQKNNQQSEEQRGQLLIWFAAGYSNKRIKALMSAEGWRPLTDSSLSHWRQTFKAEIGAAREARYSEVLSTGLALKEERVVRLGQLAEAIEEPGFDTFSKDQVAAYRGALDDIAKEVGGRHQTIDLGGGVQVRTVETPAKMTPDEWAEGFRGAGEGPAGRDEGRDEGKGEGQT